MVRTWMEFVIRICANSKCSQMKRMRCRQAVHINLLLYVCIVSNTGWNCGLQRLFTLLHGQGKICIAAFELHYLMLCLICFITNMCNLKIIELLRTFGSCPFCLQYSNWKTLCMCVEYVWCNFLHQSSWLFEISSLSHSLKSHYLHSTEI